MAKNIEPVVKALNFKELYNKRYGDIARLNNAHTLTPEQVFDLAIRYFEWAEKNHIEAAETASFQGDVYESKIHKPRIFTLNGLRLFCGFSESVTLKWRKEPGFSEVMDLLIPLSTSRNSSLPQTTWLTLHSSQKISALISQQTLTLRQTPALKL